jgi:hypothetical protein
MPNLIKDLSGNYTKTFRHSNAKLYVARQWNEANLKEEKEILSVSEVEGLVFGSFRFDNPCILSKK